jgi:hypothetical protein
MSVSGPLDNLRIGRFAALIAVTLTTCLAVSVLTHAQCAGLHAGITAQLVQVKPGFTEPAHVRLVFLLINDSDSGITHGEAKALGDVEKAAILASLVPNVDPDASPRVEWSFPEYIDTIADVLSHGRFSS